MSEKRTKEMDLNSVLLEFRVEAAGAPNPERLIVQMEVYLAPDGSVARPPQLSADTARAASADPFMRSAVEAAKLAIHVCAPYKLPADRYSVWRDISVTFDPRQLLGQ